MPHCILTWTSQSDRKRRTKIAAKYYITNNQNESQYNIATILTSRYNPFEKKQDLVRNLHSSRRGRLASFQFLSALFPFKKQPFKHKYFLKIQESFTGVAWA